MLHPLATIHTCVDLALEENDSFLQDFNPAVHKKVHEFQEHQFALVEQEMDHIRRKGKKHCNFLLAFDALPHNEFIQANTPINSIKTATKWQLWYQRLGHQLDDATQTASNLLMVFLSFLIMTMSLILTVPVFRLNKPRILLLVLL